MQRSDSDIGGSVGMRSWRRRQLLQSFPCTYSDVSLVEDRVNAQLFKRTVRRATPPYPDVLSPSGSKVCVATVSSHLFDPVSSAYCSHYHDGFLRFLSPWKQKRRREAAYLK